MGTLDQRVRVAAFKFLDALQRTPDGDLLPRESLIRGFDFEGHRVPLVSPQQGIFKPKILPSIPLSILTAPVVEGRARPMMTRLARTGFSSTDIGA